MKDWLRERGRKGAYANILQEVLSTDHGQLRKYLRINTDVVLNCKITRFFCKNNFIRTRRSKFGKSNNGPIV